MILGGAVSWMERYIKNDKKSVMGMNRIHQAHKKDKQVSESFLCEYSNIQMPSVAVKPCS